MIWKLMLIFFAVGLILIPAFIGLAGMILLLLGAIEISPKDENHLTD